MYRLNLFLLAIFVAAIFQITNIHAADPEPVSEANLFDQCSRSLRNAPSDALYYCSEALKRDPNNPNTIFKLGQANLKMKNYAEAERYGRRAYRMAHEDSRNHLIAKTALLLGNVYKLRGSLSKSKDNFIEALERCSQLRISTCQAIALSGLGYINVKRGYYTEGKNYCRRSLQMNLQISESKGQKKALLNNFGCLATIAKEERQKSDWCRYNQQRYRLLQSLSMMNKAEKIRKSLEKNCSRHSR